MQGGGGIAKWTVRLEFREAEGEAPGFRSFFALRRSSEHPASGPKFATRCKHNQSYCVLAQREMEKGVCLLV